MSESPELMSFEQLVAEVRRLRAPDRVEGHGEPSQRECEAELRSCQQRLAETESLLRKIRTSHLESYERAPVGHLALDPCGVIELANATAAQILASTRHQVIGRPFTTFVAEVDRPRFLEHLRRCETKDAQSATDMMLVSQDQQPIPVQLTIQPTEIAIRSSQQYLTRRIYRVAITCLTGRRVEEDLRASEERLKLAQAAGGVGSWDIDLRTRELRWSDEHFVLLGLEPGSVRPSYKAWRRCLHPEDRTRLSAAALCREDVSTIRLDYRILRPDGALRWLSSRGKILRDRTGRQLRMIGVTIDVTESRETRGRLEELNKALTERTREAEQRSDQLHMLASQLTQAENRERRRLALLLHDNLQQLLIAARMKLGALSQRLGPGSAADLAGQTEELIHEAITASRSLSVELSPPMLHESGLTAALGWLAGQMKDKYGLSVDVQATDEPEDDSIRTFLFQCVRELLFNAVKHAEVSEARVTMHRLDEDLVVVTVSDEGRGFDAERLEREGSTAESFGLRSIHERLAFLGGKFEIQSTPGHGTRSTLVSPIRNPRPRAAGLIAAQPGVLDTPINILIADDQSIVREGLSSLLANDGGD